MADTNYIALDKSHANELIGKLNKLLSEYSVFYINVRGYHWNLKGEKFFELHEKFEELYDELAEKIDEVAERVRTLGGVPLHSFNDYHEHADITPDKDVTDATACVQGIFDGMSVIIKQQRDILVLSDEYTDEGTNDLMGAYIGDIEKHIWMYGAFLGK